MEAESIVQIIEGVGSLLALVGIPFAAIVPGVSLIISGIFGGKKK